MAHARLQLVRARYDFCCGYCGVSEAEVGGELTVDYFHPISASGPDSEENLVYACGRCNQYKGALLPDVADIRHERRLLHPLRDDITQHLREDNVSGWLEALTASGRFHIEVLRLNRPALVVNRQRRRLMALLDARLVQALAENDALQERIARRERYIAYLEERLDDPPGQQSDFP